MFGPTIEKSQPYELPLTGHGKPKHPRLLSQASAAQSQSRWIREDNSGALQLYGQALALDQNNAAARTGINQVLIGIRNDISSAIESLQFDDADQQLQVALSASANQKIDASTLTPLNAIINNARAAHAEQQRQTVLAAALDTEIFEHLAQANNWLDNSASKLDGAYQILTRDLDGLLLRAPNNERLLALQLQMDSRAKELERAAAERRRPIRPPVSF